MDAYKEMREGKWGMYTELQVVERSIYAQIFIGRTHVPDT